ncbi:hypothetical protein ColLi_06112 [Colletotrichum liriopes]|uniref:Uncharacterized protein n=1 Tax=Colletotrichum liriopes TaxID=708192 RepID=A0AA37LSH8_9PEZI|nr:hypothetical protein ColLi_06112 [Colletotrichum liriopes]
MSTASSLETGPMTDDVLQDIFASDQDMYPAPLTWERLRSWTTAAPEVATCFYLPAEGSKGRCARTLVGAVIALPVLAPAWRDLLVGKVKETDVDAESMFARDGDPHSEAGLHVFHVERFDVPRRVGGCADSRISRCGLSSLLQSARGGRSSAILMGFEPTGYEEFWVADARGGVELVTVTADTAPKERISPGDVAVRGHATMFARHLHPANSAQ